MSDETTNSTGTNAKEETALREHTLRDGGGFEETPATQGLKTPPPIPAGEDSGEWTRGGGADPNEIKKRKREERP